MAFMLTVVDDRDPAAVRTFSPTPGGPFAVGRVEGVDCVLADDPKISRRHAAFSIDPLGRATLHDLGSTNGFRVNDVAYGGKRGLRNPDGTVPPAPLRSGDVIRIGGFVLTWTDTNAFEDDAATVEDADAFERYCDACGDPVGANSVVIAGGRVLCMTCRLVDDPLDAVSGPAAAPSPAAGNNGAENAPALPRVEGYRLTRLLGEGGVGRVYHAVRDVDGEEVAIKILPVTSSTHTSDLLLFKRESDIMRSLRHPNIVAFHAAGQADGAPFVVMEYMRGGTLAKFIRARAPLPPAEALPIIRMILSALALAHGRGVIHRDIKPLNILLDGAKKNPVAKVMDFGLAKSFLAAGLSGFTKTGASFGSLNYLPPEQLHDYKRVTPSADVFALGVVCYELLTKHSPYAVKDSDFMTAVLNHDLIPLAERNPRIPRPLAAAVDRALARDPGQRYPDAAAMLAAFPAG